jgi:hypothetical protein
MHTELRERGYPFLNPGISPRHSRSVAVNSAARSKRSDNSRTRRARRSAVALARSYACRAAYLSRRAWARSSRASSRARSAASNRSLAASNAPSACFIAARASASASSATAILRRASASCRIASRRPLAPSTTQSRMPGRLSPAPFRLRCSGLTGALAAALADQERNSAAGRPLSRRLAAG